MRYGAGLVAALASWSGGDRFDPRGSAPASLREVFARHPHTGTLLPALGYGPAQLEALHETIEHSEADVVVSATPIDLAQLLAVEKSYAPTTNFAEAGEPPSDRSSTPSLECAAHAELVKSALSRALVAGVGAARRPCRGLAAEEATTGF